VTGVALLLAGWLAAAGLAAALGLTVRRARLRAELAARACHELRGPLTAAELALHGLGRRGLPIAPVQAELARARMALADLEAAREGRHGGEQREDVDVGALLARHEPAWAAAAAAAGARLELGLPPRHARTVVRGDGVRIAQAVANLVANAAEHAGGPVRVAVRATRSTVAIEVRDDGPGLPAPVAHLARLPRAGRGARGRGLAIAAGIASRHGGRLATAPAATGARLVLELPAAPPRAAGSPARAGWAAAPEQGSLATPTAGLPEAG
jgi:signal transduction histidine kinase